MKFVSISFSSALKGSKLRIDIIVFVGVILLHLIIIVHVGVVCLIGLVDVLFHVINEIIDFLLIIEILVFIDAFHGVVNHILDDSHFGHFLLHFHHSTLDFLDVHALVDLLHNTSCRTHCLREFDFREEVVHRILKSLYLRLVLHVPFLLLAALTDLLRVRLLDEFVPLVALLDLTLQVVFRFLLRHLNAPDGSLDFADLSVQLLSEVLLHITHLFFAHFVEFLRSRRRRRSRSLFFATEQFLEHSWIFFKLF